MPLSQRILRSLPTELLFWLGGLAYLAFIDPEGSGLPSLCILKAVGITYCPGCGMGASISYVLHGDVSMSMASHPLGIFALIVIVHRIILLLKKLLFPLPHQPMKGYTHA